MWDTDESEIKKSSNKKIDSEDRKMFFNSPSVNRVRVLRGKLLGEASTSFTLQFRSFAAAT